MNNNAFIGATLSEVLGVLDARAQVSVFVGESVLLRYRVRVYELLMDEDLKKLFDSPVVGLTVALGFTSILVREV